jgi:hypothetical protein
MLPFHWLTRQNVTLEITNEDFERIFEPLESEGKEDVEAEGSEKE